MLRYNLEYLRIRRIAALALALILGTLVILTSLVASTMNSDRSVEAPVSPVTTEAAVLSSS